MSYNPTMNDKYFRRQAKFWLWAAGIVFVLGLFVWLAMRAPTSLENKDDEIESKDIALPVRIENFVDLAKEVKPIDFATLVRDLRSYPAEFKDKLYYENLGKSYTIELMDVAENDVIVDYLNGRSERKQFAYFRYLDNYKKPRYVLTFGKFTNEDEAKAAIASNDFGLPETIQAKAVKASSYLEKIDNYMRAEGIKDLATTQPRRVRLQATRNEIPVRAATRADEDLARRSQQKSHAYIQLQQERAERLRETAEARQASAAAVDHSQSSTAAAAHPRPEPQLIAPTAHPDEAVATKAESSAKEVSKSAKESKPELPKAPIATPTPNLPTAPTAAPETAPTAAPE